VECQPAHYRQTRGRPPNATRYQRHVANHRAEFAREAAREIEQLVDQERPVRVVLAGNPVAMPPLLAALAPRIRDLVQTEELRIDPRALRDEVAREVAQLIAQAEHEDDHAIADQLVEAVQADAKGDRRWAPYLRLFLAGNPLSEDAKTKQLAALKEAGVRLEDEKK